MIRRAGVEDMPAVLDIRKQVFIDEQGVSEADERDGLDGEAIHLIAYDGKRAVGTARMLDRGRHG